jgi:hypothetical protein
MDFFGCIVVVLWSGFVMREGKKWREIYLAFLRMRTTMQVVKPVTH